MNSSAVTAALVLLIAGALVALAVAADLLTQAGTSFVHNDLPTAIWTWDGNSAPKSAT